VKLTTFTTICILSFDSSINSLNPNSEQKKKPKQQEKKKKPKIKPNQTKNQNQTEGEAATKWGREGLVGFRLVSCGLSPTK
jgi:hypothetical protein